MRQLNQFTVLLGDSWVWFDAFISGCRNAMVQADGSWLDRAGQAVDGHACRIRTECPVKSEGSKWYEVEESMQA